MSTYKFKTNNNAEIASKNNVVSWFKMTHICQQSLSESLCSCTYILVYMYLLLYELHRAWGWNSCTKVITSRYDSEEKICNVSVLYWTETSICMINKNDRLSVLCIEHHLIIHTCCTPALKYRINGSLKITQQLIKTSSIMGR